jgi:hypothetical protein
MDRGSPPISLRSVFDQRLAPIFQVAPNLFKELPHCTGNGRMPAFSEHWPNRQMSAILVPR